MIVCSCHAVTDREIQRAVGAGGRTPRQIAQMCGPGSGCGGCRETVHELIAETHADCRVRVSSVSFVAAETVVA